MTIDVTALEASDADRWDDLVERSPHGTPFHRFAFLGTLAEHSNSTLHPLVGYKGQEPVGLFPLFERRRGPFAAVFSPPPDLKIGALGPALLGQEELSRRKLDRRNADFVEGCLDRVVGRGPRYVHVRVGTRYDDVRPFVWNDYEVIPGYTYVVDLAPDEEVLLERFSSDARRNVRQTREADCAVEEAGPEAIEPILDQVRARHEAQGESYRVPTSFVEDLYDRLPEGTMRTHVCTVGGDRAGGLITLETGDTVYRWQGGATPDVDLPVNDALDWYVMRTAMDRGRRRYDLAGANDRRLCRYKAKYAPRLETYNSVRSATPGMGALAGAYRRVR